MKKGSIGAIFFAVILVVAFFVVISCTERIPAGYVGVVYNMQNGVGDEVLDQGFHIVSPMKSVTTYSIGVEQSYLTSGNEGDSPKDESFTVPTSDGKSVRVSLEFSYYFDRDQITDTFIRFKGKSGVDVKNDFIKPKVKAWTQEVTARYPVTDIFGDMRTTINAELDLHLRQKFAPYGIIIDTVNFTEITVDEETAAAIQKKVNAQQELELAGIEAETARVQANREKEVAAIRAEQAIITAEAEAKAILIAAEAEAEANKQIAASLTPELIEKIKYDQWNGELPMVSGGSSLVTIDGIDVGGDSVE